MSELAFDANGEPLTFPASAEELRVRLFRNPGMRGACEVVHDKDGGALYIPVDTTYLEFRQRVDNVPGRYRLDPVDAQRRVLGNAAPAYVTISTAPRNSSSGLHGGSDERDSLIGDLVRANVEMATAISERFAAVMDRFANVVEVSVGAKQPRLEPAPANPPNRDDDQDDQDDEDELDEDATPKTARTVERIANKGFDALNKWIMSRALRLQPPAMAPAAAPATVAAPVAPPAASTPTAAVPMEEIERALVRYLDKNVLTADVVSEVAGEIRAMIAAQIPSRAADAEALEEELRTVRIEQKRLTKAVAMADDVPELVTELRQRAIRAKNLEVRIATIKRAPAELRAMIDQAEAKVRDRFANIRSALHDGSDLRQTFLKIFPDGIQFVPARVGDRQLWKIVGEVATGKLGTGPEDPWFSMNGDPDGI